MPEENYAALFAHCIDNCGSRTCWQECNMHFICVCVFRIRFMVANRTVNVLPTSVLAVAQGFEALHHNPEGSGFISR